METRSEARNQHEWRVVDATSGRRGRVGAGDRLMVVAQVCSLLHPRLVSCVGSEGFAVGGTATGASKDWNMSRSATSEREAAQVLGGGVWIDGCGKMIENDIRYYWRNQ